MSTQQVNPSSVIETAGMYYRDLNMQLREEVAKGVDRIELRDVCGQRYIGTDIDRPVTIDIYGTPGNDLGAFMNGPRIVVHGNAQDGCGNTMNDGEIVVHGHVGDIAGFSMRGGRLFIRDDAGYRVAIHMKEYLEKKPVVVIGGTAQDFLGEYMAGGILIVLGLTLKEGERHRAKFVGTGMHGGVIYLRGEIQDFQLGKELGRVELTDDDRALLDEAVGQYAAHFGCSKEKVFESPFTKLAPLSLRPYGKLYAY